MNISIIIPSRFRLNLLKQTIQSAFDLAYQPDLIETNIMYDSDDPLTEDFIYKYKNNYPNIIPYRTEITQEMRASGLNIHDLYFNPGARFAKGKYIWGTGNDVEIKTKHYDKILEEEIELFLQDKPDRLLYCQINHDSLKTPMIQGSCAYPITTKESVETIGGTMPNEITSWGADTAMFNIYRSLCANRILNLSDKILIWHWSYHTGRLHQGQISKDLSGWDGDDISYSLSTKVLHLTPQQYHRYITLLNNRIYQYELKHT